MFFSKVNQTTLLSQNQTDLLGPVIVIIEEALSIEYDFSTSDATHPPAEVLAFFVRGGAHASLK